MRYFPICNIQIWYIQVWDIQRWDVFQFVIFKYEIFKYEIFKCEIFKCEMFSNLKYSNMRCFPIWNIRRWDIPICYIHMYAPAFNTDLDKVRVSCTNKTVHVSVSTVYVCTHLKVFSNRVCRLCTLDTFSVC